MIFLVSCSWFIKPSNLRIPYSLNVLNLALRIYIYAKHQKEKRETIFYVNLKDQISMSFNDFNLYFDKFHFIS